jgi:hypothetical protein
MLTDNRILNHITRQRILNCKIPCIRSKNFVSDAGDAGINLLNTSAFLIHDSLMDLHVGIGHACQIAVCYTPSVHSSSTFYHTGTFAFDLHIPRTFFFGQYIPEATVARTECTDRYSMYSEPSFWRSVCYEVA